MPEPTAQNEGGLQLQASQVLYRTAYTRQNPAKRTGAGLEDEATSFSLQRFGINDVSVFAFRAGRTVRVRRGDYDVL